jgi:hypothetical protein
MASYESMSLSESVLRYVFPLKLPVGSLATIESREVLAAWL